MNQHLLGLSHHLLSDGRKADLLRGAFKELHTQFILQLLNHGAQRGLRYATLVGRLGKMAQTAHCYDVLQLLKIHIGYCI